MTSNYEIIFQSDGRRGKFSEGTSILQAARELGVDIKSICGGVGSCGKCIVKIYQNESKINRPTPEEVELIGSKRLAQGFRLACRAEIMGNAVIHIPKESRTGAQKLQTEGLDTPVKLEPLVIVQNIDDSIQILYGDEILETLPSEEVAIHGFSVDIGSTKLAGYLMDLSTGNIVSIVAAMNPQIKYGEDIMSRLTYAMKGGDAKKAIHETLVHGIKLLLEEACVKASSDPVHVYDIVLVGNSAMQHFLLDLDPTPLSQSPFTPKKLGHVDLESAVLGLGNPKGKIHFLPLISGFVGADCIASILATGVHKSEELCFLIDIGTNTEIVIGNKERMVACSCASGPAFEGAHIKHGMRAASGAIEGVWIDHKSLEPSIKTIDDATPLGICGSGFIDVLSEMLKVGIVDTSGKIRTEIMHIRIRKRGNSSEYVLTWEQESGLKEDIVITQLDVRELQKGKAAMFSGAQIAMSRLDVSPSDITNVYIAGAFGTYIDRESAMDVGMIPEFNPWDIEQVGNAAGTGARMALLSRSAREETKEIQRKVKYVELATLPEYNQAYVDALMFPHRDLNLFPETVRKLESINLIKSQMHRK